MIPMKYLCKQGGGDGVSPPLAWTPGPSGTMSYALVMRDQSIGGFLHWVAWDIPVGVNGLPEGVENVYAPSDPAGMKQAPFNQNVVGYFGPCSPNSVNDYEITIYAIDAATIDTLNESSNKDDAEKAILQHEIASTKLTGKS
jgi:Raf kinase inhibitor-like YbhB/YbcL family protein